MAKLGFGKYGDLPLEQVPEEYLDWLIRSSQEKIKMCQDELSRREIAAEASLSWLEKLVKTGWRELTKRHHPDVGGTTAEMQEINAAYEKLKSFVKR